MPKVDVEQLRSKGGDLSQLSRASLLKAAVAALLLLLRWMLAMVSEFFTTSMSPILFPVDKQPYGIIL
ncbi:hypothetical protein EYF80_002011 [Liparis tanakae]|uniref:Uncharacterized protein n=1 Tax=Liparis tanakae TaxID=230148 RepID=A0A4Z2JCX0_9TELE|nr:hypothetical protein EYF80_002011 [Liparis tanakae]